MKRKWIVAIVIVILLIVGGLFWRQKSSVQSKEAGAVQTAKVTRKDFTKTISSSGKTDAAKSVELKFQTSGKLTWVGVKEGDKVSAYQTLATMDAREVQKSLEKALRDYSKQRNDFEEMTRETYDNTFDPNIAPNDTIKRILQKNQWDLEKAVLDVELKHLALEYAALVTPIAGTVTHIDTPIAGINITPATAVFEVVDPGSIVFEAKIDEVDVGALAIGQIARVSLDAHPQKTFDGTIVGIAYSAEISSGGATVFPVKIAITDSEGLRVGFNGDVVIETEKASGALVVPVTALREEDKAKYVYRKNNGKYEKVAVTTGLMGEDEVVIIDGLNEGDSVVTKGFSSIPTE